MALSARRISSNKLASLVFDLDGMHHEAAGIASLVDQEDRTDADGDQHQKSRCQQQDLPNSAAALSINRHDDLAS